MNTTIGVVATDAALDHGGLQRLAAMAQGGYAYAIRPIHTPFDGDTVFALATGAVPLPDKPDALVRLGAIAADVVARAVMRGVYEAETLGDMKSYAETRRFCAPSSAGRLGYRFRPSAEEPLQGAREALHTGIKEGVINSVRS